MDKTQDVRMRYAHHSHICATPDAALLHNIGHLVNDVHERHWTRRNTGRRAHHGAVWPQKLISHAGAAASLVNGSRSLGMLHDSGKRVGDIQNKTRRELSICFTGVDQTRSVGDEFASEHHFAHSGKKLVSFFARFGHGNMSDYATHNVSPLLKRAPLRILQRITFADYLSGVDSKLLRAATRGNGRGASALVSYCFADSCAHLSLPFEKSYARRSATPTLA